MTIAVVEIVNRGVICGDCLTVLRGFPANYVDTIITDAPYGYDFMGKHWDKGVPGIAYWEEMLRVAKPGATLMAFGGTRTHHRLMVAIEDSGWEIRDCMMWLYGQGFPKSYDISKGIDKAKGVEREVVGTYKIPADSGSGRAGKSFIRLKPTSFLGTSTFSRSENMGTYISAPATPEAHQWDGYGTALKPAYEIIIVAQKPVLKRYVKNALEWGVAGLNIDGARIGTKEDTRRNAEGGENGLNGSSTFKIRKRKVTDKPKPIGRWPANVILSHSPDCLQECVDDCPVRLLDGQSGESKSSGGGGMKDFSKSALFQGDVSPNKTDSSGLGDTGGASRFFYCAKASKGERGSYNNHATVKPLKLLEYLCTLTKTPTGGIVLDPFSGSMSTALACINTGRDYIMIEQEPHNCWIGKQRIDEALKIPKQLTLNNIE